MSFKIIFHPIASKEYQRSFAWYEERLEGLGNRFENAISERLAEISITPELYPIKKGNFREAKTESFPYLIVYKVYKQKRIVFISAVYHTSRSPGKKYLK